MTLDYILQATKDQRFFICHHCWGRELDVETPFIPEDTLKWLLFIVLCVLTGFIAYFTHWIVGVIVLFLGGTAIKAMDLYGNKLICKNCRNKRLKKTGMVNEFGAKLKSLEHSKEEEQKKLYLEEIERLKRLGLNDSEQTEAIIGNCELKKGEVLIQNVKTRDINKVSRDYFETLIKESGHESYVILFSKE